MTKAAHSPGLVRRLLVQPSPFLASFILLTVWALSVTFTWGIVENPLYDFPSLLHAAERYAAGDIMYRDFQWLYLPLPLSIYGLTLRMVPKAYGALSALSATIALFILFANYRLARLLLRRPAALLLAIAAYLAFFTTSSAGGPNFVCFGFILLGVGLFSWLVWCVATSLTSTQHRFFRSCTCGVLAGLCTLNKHEQIAGVAAVTAFLITRRFVIGNRRDNFLLTPFLVSMLLVSAGGYAYTVFCCGWAPFAAAFTAYGTAMQLGLRNLPSLITIWLHLLLLTSFVPLLLVAAAAGMHSGDYPTLRRRRRLWVTSGLLVLLAVGGFLGELVRIRHLADNTQWETAPTITASLASYGMFARGTGHVTAAVQYIGGFVCRNVVPATLIGGILFVAILCRLYRRGVETSMPLGTQTALLLVVAAGGLQIRPVFSYSSHGTFELLFPVITFLLPYYLRPIWSSRSPLSDIQRWRVSFAAFLGAYTLILSVAVYCYEFRASRFFPVKLNTDKGTIRMPNTPENQALAEMVNFVRSTGRTNIFALPYDGIQFWTGNSAPVSWPGLLQPSLFHYPWSEELVVLMTKRPVTVVVFEQLDAAAFTVPQSVGDWVDGPTYVPFHWKEAYPALWATIQMQGRLLAVFRASDKPFFSVYTLAPPPHPSTASE